MFSRGRNTPPMLDQRALQCSLVQWFDSPLGRQLLSQERRQLDTVLPYLFGYHLLQLGWIADADLLKGSRIGHRLVLDMEQLASAGRSNAHENLLGGCPQALPIATDCLDVVVLPHTLEFNPAPHQVLREVERTLIPEGHVIVLGFNPWSLWMLWRLLRRRSGKAPWCGHFLSATRLKDWLALLGFDIVTVRHYFYRPPLQRRGLMRRLRFMEAVGGRFWPVCGGGYLLVAKKRVTTLTPIRPRWQSRRRLAASALAGSQRMPHD